MIIRGIKMNETATERRNGADAIAAELKAHDEATERSLTVIPREDQVAFRLGMLQQRGQISGKGRPVAVRFGVPTAPAKLNGRSEMLVNALSRSGQ